MVTAGCVGVAGVDRGDRECECDNDDAGDVHDGDDSWVVWLEDRSSRLDWLKE